MKLNKLVSMMVVASMAAALLAGCGGNSEAETADQADPAASAATEETAEEAPTFDETQTISMYGLSFYGDAGLAEVQDAINEISLEKINVQIEYTPMDVATYMEQIGLMLSGGEAFDLTMLTSIPVVSFSTMQSQNELYDITDILPEYAPELYEMMSDYWGGVTVDGRIYGVPTYRMYASDYYIMMRKDVLDELGLTEQAQAISSWSEYKAILEQVRDAQDSLPEELQTNAMICNSDSSGNLFNDAYSDNAADSFADDFGFETLSDSLKIIYVDDEGKVNNFYATDDCLTLYNRAHEWYEDGLVYKDAATSEDIGDTLMSNGVGFSSIVTGQSDVQVAKENAIGHELVMVKIHSVPIQTSVVGDWGWAVPTTSENPEAAVAFMNLMWTDPDIENLFVYGIEGRDYEVVDGEAVIKEDHVYQSSDFFYGNQFAAYPSQGLGADFRDVALEEQNNAEISPYFGCRISTEPIANEVTALSNTLTKYTPGLQSGTTDPADTYEQMLSELEASGLQTVLDYYQESLDAWLAEQ